MPKNYSKFNLSHTLGLKTTKSPPRNPLIKGLNPTKEQPSFPKFFSFYFGKFASTKVFNIQ
jgi:hypothetical protein